MVAEKKPTDKRRHVQPDEPASGTKLVRLHLLVDQESLDRLRDLLHMTSASDAVREAIDRVLLVEEAHAISELLMARGAKVEDLYQPPPPMPVYFGPDEVIEAEEDGEIS